MATQAKESQEKGSAPVPEPPKPEFQVDRDKVWFCLNTSWTLKVHCSAANILLLSKLIDLADQFAHYPCVCQMNFYTDLYFSEISRIHSKLADLSITASSLPSGEWHPASNICLMYITPGSCWAQTVLFSISKSLSIHSSWGAKNSDSLT